jgi:hypothetical protein
MSDPSTILCESCGYTIEGLPADANCPECGRPAPASFPERARPGSPWQRRPGLRAFLATNWATLRHPMQTFASVRLDATSGATLLAINLLIAAVIFIAPWSGTVLDAPGRAVRTGQTSALLYAGLILVPLQILLLAAVLLVLTLIEWAGIQFFARRRGARLCRLAAWQVVAHASVGWIIAAGAVWLSLVLWLNLSFLDLFPSLARLVAASNWAAGLIPGIGGLAGLLVFEILVSIGVHRCRFANRPRPHTAPAPA